MATINMDSILAKARQCVNKPSIKNKIETTVDKHIMNDSGGIKGRKVTFTGMKEAAIKFIDILKNEISNLEASSNFEDGALGSSAVSALSKLEYGTPKKVGTNRYEIEVWFSEDLSRPSLSPSLYDGVENIAALLNTGYSASHSVYGIWEGHSDEKIPSLKNRSGAHFIDNAVQNFMASYANEYGVLDIEIDEIYK